MTTTPAGARSETPTGKIVPLALPSGLVDRPALRTRLDGAAGRRLTTVVAGAGFGKSTLLAGWAAGVRAAWYTVGPEDAALPVLLRGLLDALRLRLPALPAAAAAVLGSSLGPDSDELARADDMAAVLGELLDREVHTDLVLVLDDLQELPPAGPAARLVAGLCRHAPARLHLVLSSRTDPPFPVGRLRGRGQLLELDGGLLRFSVPETAALLTAVLGADGAGLAPELHRWTGGWPAATVLAAESLRLRPADQRAAGLAALARPGGGLYAYLAEEVFGQEAAALRELVRTVAPLPRFSAGLCAALGLDWDAAALAGLARQGLFLEPGGGLEGWFALGSLVREFALGPLRLPPAEARRVHTVAADWLAGAGHLGDALGAVAALGGEPAAAYLARHGPALLAAGAADRVVAVAAALPAALRTPAVDRLEGQARQVRGDWPGALACFRRAAGPGPGSLATDAGLAWRTGLIHYLRGELDEAMAAFERARPAPGTADGALLSAWTAGVHWLRGEVAECRAAAEAAYADAVASGADEALSAAHTVLAMLAALDGDRAANDAHYLRALEAAERAGDALQLARIRANRGSLCIEEGDFGRALDELDLAIRLAELNGFAAVLGLALVNRGEAYRWLGRLDEAIADYEASRAACQRAGTGWVAYPLVGLGDVYRERGDLSLAASAYAEAVRQAERSADQQGLVPALAGLALVVAAEEPPRAVELAARALAAGRGMAWVGAQLAAGWVALDAGDRTAAATHAEEAATAAGARRDRAGLAGALELAALAAAAPRQELGRLREAAAIRAGIGDRVGEARAAYALARLGAGAPAAAEHRLRALGVREQAAGAAGLLRAVSAPPPDPVRVQALGGFRVLRDGVPVRVEEWQSKKARDLLKLLVARRGRPATREVLAEALWPGEEADRVANRLSVALSTVRTVLDPARQEPPDAYVLADRHTVRLGKLPVDVEDFLATATAGLDAAGGGDPDAGTLLAGAEAAYGGDFCEDDPYEDWAVPLREEARAAYLAVARALAARATAAGEHDLAVRYHLRVLERDAYDETAHLGLVATLAEAGRHGEARRRYRSYAERMDEIDVEVEPFPAVRRRRGDSAFSRP